MLESVIDDTFEENVLQSVRPVLVYFWADWCEECAPLLQTVIEVADEKRLQVSFVTIDVDACPKATRRCAIDMVPMLVLFISGQEVDRIKGLTNRKALSSTIDMYLSSSVNVLHNETDSIN